MKKLLTLACFLSIVLSANLAYSQNEVNGYIYYHNNPEYPLPEVTVSLFDEAGELVSTFLTGDDGYYEFSGLNEGIYSITATTDLEGPDVTIQDALNILFYLNGIMQFTPYQVMAADVTGNGQVNMQDFVFIVVQHLVFGNPFPAGDWQFDELFVSTFSRDGEDTLSSGGVKSGGTVGVWLPTGRDYIEELSLTPEGSLVAAQDELIHFPLQLSNTFDLNGYLMVLDYDAAMFEITSVDPAIDNVNVSIDNGQIRMSWINTDLAQEVNLPQTLADFTIRVLQNGRAFKGMAFEINPESHFIDRSGEFVNFFDILAPEIIFKSLGIDEAFSVSPNPASDIIQVRLDAGTNAQTIKMYNSAGQLVRNWQVDLAAKQHSYYIGDMIPGIYQLIVIDSRGDLLNNHRLLIR
jgi:hypothetical protein